MSHLPLTATEELEVEHVRLLHLSASPPHLPAISGASSCKSIAGYAVEKQDMLLIISFLTGSRFRLCLISVLSSPQDTVQRSSSRTLRHGCSPERRKMCLAAFRWMFSLFMVLTVSDLSTLRILLPNHFWGTWCTEWPLGYKLVDLLAGWPDSS